MYSGCSRTVSYSFSHKNRGLYFIIACWEFPSISSSSWPPSLYCMCGERVWGLRRSTRLTDRLVVPSAAPSALRLHCSALSGRAAGQLLTIVSDRPATWYHGSRRLPASLWDTDAECTVCVHTGVCMCVSTSPSVNQIYSDSICDYNNHEKSANTLNMFIVMRSIHQSEQCK